MQRHWYALGWGLGGAVLGALAVALTAAFAIGSLLCFLVGFAVERRLIGLHDGRMSWDKAVSSLPFEVRRKPHAARPAPPLGILDFEQLALRATEQSARILEGMTADQVAMTAMINRYTPRFAAVWTTSTDRKIRLSKEFSSKLQGFVRKLDARETALRSVTDVMADNNLRLIEGAAVVPTQFRDTIARLRDATTTSRASASGWRQSIVDARSQNIQQAINEAYDDLIAVATRVISDFDRTIRYTTEALRLIDGKATAAKQSTRRTPKAPRR